MLYRALRAINARYTVVAFGFFATAFFVALLTMVYPIVPLAILFSSIYLVVLAWIGRCILKGTERALARRALRQGSCPACEGRTVSVAVAGGTDNATERRFDCQRCRMRYAEDGDDWDAEHDDLTEADRIAERTL